MMIRKDDDGVSERMIFAAVAADVAAAVGFLVLVDCSYE